MMRWLFRRHYQAGEFWRWATTFAVNDVHMQLVWDKWREVGHIEARLTHERRRAAKQRDVRLQSKR